MYQSPPPVPDKLNMFIKVVVLKLYQQRKSDVKNGQFAVLFLGNKNSEAEYELSKCFLLKVALYIWP